MRKLFEFDRKNYRAGGTIGRRPSVRGIIVKNGRLAMVHSLKYDYYKLPGGGIENGETHEETLIREVREESGLIVKRDTIKEFGYVCRIEKGRFEDIFIQDNYHYLCEVEDVVGENELDNNEAYDEYVLEFVHPSHAIEVNQAADHKEKSKDKVFCGMLERENRVLQIILDEVFEGK